MNIITCEEFNRYITLHELIGYGIEGYVFSGITNYDFENIKKDTQIVLKYAGETVEKQGKEILQKESVNYNALVENIYPKMTKNFAKLIDFGKCCLFERKNYIETISSECFDMDIENIKMKYGSMFPSFLELSDDKLLTNLKIYYPEIGKEIPDVVYYYANKDSLNSSIIEKLLNMYSNECLLMMKESLKVQNFHLIEQIFPLDNNSFKNTKIQYFLESSEIYDFDEITFEELIKCNFYIILTKINGKDIEKIVELNPLFEFDQSAIFEIFYTYCLLFYHLGLYDNDRHYGNAMIENKLDTVRIYKIFDKYYKFELGQKFYLIDLVEFRRSDKVPHKNIDQEFPVNLITNKWSNLFPSDYIFQGNVSVRYIFENIFPTIFEQFMIEEDEFKENMLNNVNIEYCEFEE